MKLSTKLVRETLDDLVNLELGLFWPLQGFMSSHDYHSVVEHMTLSDGSVWTIPITLAVDHATFLKAADADRLHLTFEGREVGFIHVEDCYRVAKKDVRLVFGTEDPVHPGVRQETTRSEYRIGGKVKLTDRGLLAQSLDPVASRALFRERGWKTIAGFQTRNPIHRAHEYHQRMCLELCDGLFINPVTGWKQPNDFTEKAIETAYRKMIDTYYPRHRVHYAGVRTPMRYAGPREAIFHAILRRNVGCTHFVIGRDHAGVGGFYEPYAAHELARTLQKKNHLGIELLLFREPYHCARCGYVVTDRTCACGKEHKFSISGSAIRQALREGKHSDSIHMRPDIAEAIIALGNEKFVAAAQTPETTD
jgi:sulfate adenylyltransferase